MLNMLLVDEIIRNALKEDVGTGDITTESVIGEEVQVFGNLIAKENGIICGMGVFERVFYVIDPDIRVTAFVADGEYVESGKIIAEISGSARGVLTGERVSLNLLQRMSGIATATNTYAKKLSGTKTMVTDTRKTTPGLRVLEKYAVLTGGGRNHRHNLSDGVLIKDNHIKAAGGISEAVAAAREKVPHTIKIEVETENLDMVREALGSGADIIMLDNMSIDKIREAVKLIDKRALTEASGNMDMRDITEVAEAGVDIISIGALTHSPKALDISLKFV